MTVFDWDTTIAETSTHLAGLGKLPPPLAQHPALQAIAVLSLAPSTGIRHQLTPASTVPALTIPRYAGRHDLVDDLMAELTSAVADPSRVSPCTAFSASNWITEHSLDNLVVLSAQHTADDTGRYALLSHAASKAANLNEQYHRLKDQHMQALLERDAPELDASTWGILQPDVLRWILASKYDGDSSRAIRIQRRLQALRLFASIADRLREPAITDVIDTGDELAPVLAQRLGLTRAQLNTLREATPPGAFTSYQRHNFEHAVIHLQAHAVPLHQWPGGGRPAQPQAWATSPWLNYDELTPIRTDYYGSDRTIVRDAVRGFTDDLLAPLLAEIASPRDIGTGDLFNTLEFLLHSQKRTHELTGAVQQFLAGIRRALVGERGPNAFQEAARVWHRRAAAVAALRNENQTDRPGWPPLCPPWVSPCGEYRIVPLTTAKALLEEGEAHHHCVGTYYETCRSGSTQILSVRHNGQPAVTAEILLNDRISSIRVNQFKGLHDEVPSDPAIHQAMRDFLHDLRTGKHPLNRRELRTYRQWANDSLYAWNRRALSIVHARQAFPLYLTLLPRRTPTDFDLWCKQTGLREALRNALALLKNNGQCTAV
jgi:hypothetical protein